MKPTVIPTRHDDPPWFLFFRLDEIAPFLALLVVGIITHTLMPCLVAGWVFSYFYKKLNSKYPRGFVIHWAYGKGLYCFSMTQTMSRPFNRRFLPTTVKAPLDVDFTNFLKKKD